MRKLLIFYFKINNYERFNIKKLRNNFLNKNLKKKCLSVKSKMEIGSNLLESVNSVEPQKLIKENTTEILEPFGKKVFYNPVQEFNRDLSVLVLQLFSKQFHNKSDSNASGESQKSFRILEALSATGLRSIRYAKEIPNVTEVIANDFSNEAVKNIEMNIKHNNVENIAKPSHHDAVELMFKSIHLENRFQAVDIDPYGSPVQFLDTAVQCVADEGMLLVTCTDVSVLCGVYPETCFAKYGALSLKTQGKHEMAIRILLHSIQSHASKYKRFIVPVLSVSADFYIRVFVKVYTSALACKEIFSKLSMIYECCGCGAKIFQPLGSVNKNGNGKKVQYLIPHLTEVSSHCVHCGGAQKMGGPIWTAPIHDYKFVDEMIKSNEIKKLATFKRLLGMLTLIQEELHEIPLYYSIGSLSKTVKCVQMPLLTLRSAILNAGYRVSTSHASKDSLKTDAPMSFLWDVFRTWVKEKPVNKNNVIPGSPGDRILNTSIQNKVNFTERADANPLSRKMGLLRYQINPAPHWGPGTKSTTMSLGESISLKKKGRAEEKNIGCKKQKTE